MKSYCKNCKGFNKHRKNYKNNYLCGYTKRREGYLGTFHYNICLDLNATNDCELYKPKLIVRIKNFFNKRRNFE